MGQGDWSIWSNGEAGVLKRDGLIDEVVLATGGTYAEAKSTVEAILDGITRALSAGHRVEIRGFGTFGVRQRRSRVGRNPKTGARVEVPSKPSHVMAASMKLDDSVQIVEA
jgi:integration host factor subunit beta